MEQRKIGAFSANPVGLAFMVKRLLDDDYFQMIKASIF